MCHTLSVLLLKYPTPSQVAMNKSLAVKGICAGNTLAISLLALSSKSGLMLSRYHTFPVPLVSTSAQNGATIACEFPPSGNGSDVNCGGVEPKPIAPLTLTYSKNIDEAVLIM